jgi:TorA maturation chaperone TorD
MSASPASLAFARAAVYRLLSASLAYPTPEARARLLSALPGARAAAPHLPPEARAALRRLARALHGIGPDDAERVYVRAFGHAGTPAAVPYEAAYVTTNVFQETDVLAQVAGLYRAFGVAPDRERPDHVTLELEFAHLLCFKEGHARRHHGPEAVAVCIDAQRAFLAAHLGRWAGTFFRHLRAGAAGTHYALVADLGERFCAAEAARAGAVPIARAPRVPDAVEPGAWSCPLAPEAIA